MIIRHATEEQIDQALAKANENFDNNLIYNRFERDGKNYNVTLKVKSSKGPGHRLGFGNHNGDKQRRLASACWHAHGYFIDALPKDAEVVTTLGGERRVTSPSDSWRDANVGSRMYPAYLSELCECVY